MQQLRKSLIGLGVAASLASLATAIADIDAMNKPIISPKTMADALHLVMDSDRSVYTRTIVNRLVKKDKVITASEHFEDDKALALPAQMFRFGAELVAERAEELPDVKFSYSLQSLWPVNKQNAPKTAAVQQLGIRHIAYGVKDKHYDTVGAALLWTLEAGLGDGFTDDVRDAWATVYGILADTMKAAAREAAA